MNLHNFMDLINLRSNNPNTWEIIKTIRRLCHLEKNEFKIIEGKNPVNLLKVNNQVLDKNAFLDLEWEDRYEFETVTPDMLKGTAEFERKINSILEKSSVYNFIEIADEVLSEEDLLRLTKALDELESTFTREEWEEEIGGGNIEEDDEEEVDIDKQAIFLQKRLDPQVMRFLERCIEKMIEKIQEGESFPRIHLDTQLQPIVALYILSRIVSSLENTYFFGEISVIPPHLRTTYGNPNEFYDDWPNRALYRKVISLMSRTFQIECGGSYYSKHHTGEFYCFWGNQKRSIENIEVDERADIFSHAHEYDHFDPYGDEEADQLGNLFLKYKGDALFYDVYGCDES